ncbi:MAG: sigma 54-interacting transcriptional regulator [SAR324 cluster bacterium]|nr:sigma 54-interacting transcriptional regulator [SAR324 cluster bacterium]
MISKKKPNPMGTWWRRMIQKVKPSTNVLICGESSAGKELIAKAIQNESTRAKHIILAISCAAIPDGRLESELFGSVKGSYTGSVSDKPGLFGEANRAHPAAQGKGLRNRLPQIIPSGRVRTLLVVAPRAGCVFPSPERIEILQHRPLSPRRLIRTPLHGQSLGLHGQSLGLHGQSLGLHGQSFGLRGQSLRVRANGERRFQADQ